MNIENNASRVSWSLISLGLSNRFPLAIKQNRHKFIFLTRRLLVFEIRHGTRNTRMNLEEYIYMGLLIPNFIWIFWAIWRNWSKFVFFDQMMARVCIMTLDPKHDDEYIKRMLQGSLDPRFLLDIPSDFRCDQTKLTEIRIFRPNDG